MSGHSKWATIKHKKGAADAKRGKVFSKLSKEIMIVAKQSGGDINMNPGLRMLLLKAKSVNMPNDNIERAIKKGTGELEGQTFDEVSYEGFAAGGVGIVVQALTDNKNRATSEIRHTFSRYSSSFATVGAVSRGFVRKGEISIDAASVDEDKVMSIVLDAGAEDMVKEGDSYEITTEPSAFNAVSEALEKAGIKTTRSEVGLVPLTPVPINDKQIAQQVMKFVEALEENEDVQNVYNNMDCSDEVLKELEKE